MSFNKKRACCCGGPAEVDVAWFELKSVVPIDSSEQVIAKTYSYWFRRPSTTFVSGSVPDSTVLWERGTATNANTNLTADLTYGDWKSAGVNTACVAGGGGSAYVGVDPASATAAGGPAYEALGKALDRRGWYLDATTRVLTEAQWKALDECKVEMVLPNVFGTGAGAANSIEIYRRSGWMFGGGQYSASPAIGPITKGNLTWEVYPKVNCNYPVRGDVHDFTALFPSTITLPISGSTTIGYKVFTGGGGTPIKFASVALSGSYTLTKTNDEFGISYQQTSPDPTQVNFLGEVDVVEDDLQGGSYTRTLKAVQNTLNVNLKSAFSTVPNTGGTNIWRDGTSSACTNEIGYNMDSSRVACQGCNPNANSKSYTSLCCPANFDGDALKARNYEAINATSLVTAPDKNTLGVDLGLSSNYPTDEAFNTHFQNKMLNGLWAGPLLTWGAATGSTVAMQIKKPSAPGLQSFLVSQPTQTCCNPSEGNSPITFYGNVQAEFIGFGDGDTNIPFNLNNIGFAISET